MGLTALSEPPMVIFDPLIANDENPNNKILTLFFGIPKGTFYKKSPLAGYGAEPHEASLIVACSRGICGRGRRFVLLIVTLVICARLPDNIKYGRPPFWDRRFHSQIIIAAAPCRAHMRMTVYNLNLKYTGFARWKVRGAI